MRSGFEAMIRNELTIQMAQSLRICLAVFGTEFHAAQHAPRRERLSKQNKQKARAIAGFRSW